MSLALEYVVDVSTKAQFDRWAFNHYLDHLGIITAVKAKFGIKFNQYPIYPIAPGSESEWLLMHQEMHDAMDGLLKIQSYNLLTTNPFDKGSRSQFFYFNFMEHLAAAKALGIG